ncbi:MAG: alpha/beta hydrolase [Labilithrix sp.]
MKRSLGLLGALGGLALIALHSAACSDDDPVVTTNPADAGSQTDTGSSTGTDSGNEAGGAVTLGDPTSACTDDDAAIYADPGAIPSGDENRGKILKCSKGTELTKDALAAELTRVGYAGKPPSTGAKVYKITYVTTRGNAAHSPAVSSALVYAPTTPRAAGLPVVVTARGSRGQAARCAVSKHDPSLQGLNDDADRLNFSLVANGYAVIMPDLAGYVNFGAAGNPPSAYAGAEDVGRSTLDGSRALKAMFPTLGDKTVLVGHSQGGHSAFSALSLAASYGAVSPIAGVAVYAPLWFSQRTWAALLSSDIVEPNSYTTTNQETASAVSIFYTYTHAELLDGPGEGLKLFQPANQAFIKKFVEEGCYGENADLKAKTDYSYKLFDGIFAASVGQAGLGTCVDDLCKKWEARFLADRPHLTGIAATTPILLMYGGKDTTIPPGRMKCGLDYLHKDGATLSVCTEAEATHGTIINTRGDYAADWIASLTLGAAPPAACATGEETITATCATPPPND